MDTTRNPLNSSQLTRPTYDELLHENAQLKQRVAQLEGQVDALMSQIKVLQSQVAKLTAALDEARRAGNAKPPRFASRMSRPPNPRRLAASRASVTGRTPIAARRRASTKLQSTTSRKYRSASHNRLRPSPAQ